MEKILLDCNCQSVPNAHSNLILIYLPILSLKVLCCGLDMHEKKSPDQECCLTIGDYDHDYGLYNYDDHGYALHDANDSLNDYVNDHYHDYDCRSNAYVLIKLYCYPCCCCYYDDYAHNCDVHYVHQSEELS